MPVDCGSLCAGRFHQGTTFRRQKNLELSCGMQHFQPKPTISGQKTWKSTVTRSDLGKFTWMSTGTAEKAPLAARKLGISHFLACLALVTAKELGICCFTARPAFLTAKELGISRFKAHPAFLMAKELGIPRFLAPPAFEMAKEPGMARFGGRKCFPWDPQVGAFHAITFKTWKNDFTISAT